VPPAVLLAPSGSAHPASGTAHFTYAESIAADEPSVAPCAHDITGATGLKILRAIVAGERDALKLAQWRDSHCKASQETIVKALTGDWKDELLFVLKQSLELYDFYTAQVAACDAQLQQQFSVMNPVGAPTHPSGALPVKRRTSSKNHPASTFGAEMIRLTGIDLGAMSGLSDSSIQTLLSEIGTDMTKWPPRSILLPG